MHIYWAFGGTWAKNSAIPTKKDGTKVLHPKMFDTLLVALGLLFFTVYYLMKLDWFHFSFLPEISYYLGWIIPGIFTLRVLGELRYVGIFKTIKSTHFARMDNQLFIPLCLIIAILGIYIQLNSVI